MVLMDKTSEIRMISLDKNTSGDLMITKIPCIFGSRRSESDIVISSGAVSRKHAKLVRTEEGICLSDLSSTNGTYVNGEKLKEKEERYLMPEDIITFADVRFIYCGNHMPL
jgi:pSer/pThr/pTyr-binding forkhead associated (FHA) protein